MRHSTTIERTWLTACALLGAALGAHAQQQQEPVDPRVAAILARSRADQARDQATPRAGAAERRDASRRFWNDAAAPQPAASAAFGLPDPALARGTFGAPAPAGARRSRRTEFFGGADRASIFASTSQRSLYGSAGRDEIYGPPYAGPTAHSGEGWDDDLIGARHLAERDYFIDARLLAERDTFTDARELAERDKFIDARRMAERRPVYDWHARRYR